MKKEDTMSVDTMPADIRTTVYRVVVIDDHRIFTDLVSLALASEPRMECVGTAGTAAQARQVVSEHQPDIALIDVRMPDGDGVNLARELLTLAPNMRVLMLTAFPSPALVE